MSRLSKTTGRLALIALALVAAWPAAAQTEPPKAKPVIEDKAPPPNPNSYRLKPNDVVKLSVYEEADLSSQTRILKSGEAVFPLIGTVQISGLTVETATKKIRDLYAADYLVDPKVTLTVDEYATDFISVVGAVGSPGQIPIPASGKLDLAAALATAGGLAPNADPNNINLIRANGGSSTFSQSSIQSGGGVSLAPGDRIVVHESRFLKKSVSILGQVRQPGSVEFPLDGNLDLITAIARAGGFTELANPKKVSINRRGKVTVIDMREMTERGNTRYPLQPDDIVTVAERLF